MLNLKVNIALLLLAIFQVNANDLKVSTSFRKIGRLATGLSYGHLHATLNLKTLKQSHQNLENFLIEQLRTVKTTNEKILIQTIQGNLTPSKTTLMRLDLAFFHDIPNRPKRQALLGLALGGGLLSFGLSIYNTIQISNLNNKIKNMETGFEHVIHAFEEENHSIMMLANSVNDIKRTCQILLTLQETEQKEITFLTQSLLLNAMIQTHNAEVSSWARGLEALLHGHLLPTLVNPAKLQHAVQIMSEKAEKRGLRLLHTEKSSVYKSPISFLANDQFELEVFIHLPLIDSDPIDLFEYIPIPLEIQDMLVTIEADRQILATDSSGNRGIELSKIDLLHCQMEKMHLGNTYVCPNTNLLRNDIRQTCLGSLFFSLRNQIPSRCHHYIQKTSEVDNFALQTGPKKFILFARENLTLLNVCRNGTQNIQNVSGITTIEANVNCTIVTDHHTFKPQLNIDVDENFLERPIFMPQDHLIGYTKMVDLQRAYDELAKVRTPERLHLGKLQNWLRETSQSDSETTIAYSVSFVSIVISSLMLTLFVYLFCIYKRSVSCTSNKD